MGVPLLVDQDVGRLEVAVQDAPRVRVRHRLGRLGDQPRGGPRLLLVAGHQRHQAAAGHQLHAEVMLALVLADLVDRHDAEVVEQRDGLGFILEAAKLVVAGEEPGLDHLQRDGPVEADLTGLVDDPHAAAAQFAPDLVVAEVADGRYAARQVSSPSASPRVAGEPSAAGGGRDGVGGPSRVGGLAGSRSASRIALMASGPCPDASVAVGSW